MIESIMGVFIRHDARTMPLTMPPSFRPCVVAYQAFARVATAFVTMVVGTPCACVRVRVCVLSRRTPDLTTTNS
eukprot:2276159-Alexandrium_andersonii.AAC.1